MKQFCVLLAVIGFGLTSCERHTWETKTEEHPEGKSSDAINLYKHEVSHSGDGEDSKKGEEAKKH